MTSIRESIRRLIQAHQPLPPGMHHFQASPDSPVPYRLHLRLEPDGSGVLIVNASTVLHLNKTAAEYAYHLVKQTPQEEVAKQITRRYRTNRQQVMKDFQNLVERIDTLIKMPDLDPETFLDFERSQPYSRDISAPYRLDCAVTYRLPEGEDPAYAPIQRVKRELTTQEWLAVVDNAWRIGIPHIILTGGEPTLRDDLVELIARTETNGQVVGLLTDGLKFANPDYLNAVLQAGLDHIMFLLHPDNPHSWAALEALIKADIFVNVHLTIFPANAPSVPGLLNRLAEMDVKSISLSVTDPDLKDSMREARQKAADLGLSLVWDLPVPYSDEHPVAQETMDEQVHGEGKAWMYLEPDGDVLPAQGDNRVLGNFLTDPWETIWAKARG